MDRRQRSEEHVKRKLDNVRHEGVLAFLDGKPRRIPYKQTALRKAWAEGYDDATKWRREQEQVKMIDITKPTFTIEHPIDDLYIRMASTSGLDGGNITRVWVRAHNNCTFNVGMTVNRAGHTHHTIFVFQSLAEHAPDGRHTEIHISGVPRDHDVFTSFSKGEFEVVFVPNCSYGLLTKGGSFCSSIWSDDVVVYPQSEV